MSNNVLIVQKRLTELGYDVGPLDGIRGRRVIAAVKQFQHNNGLAPDGMVGRNTYAKMFAKPHQQVKQPIVAYDAFPWLEQAFSIKGLHEVRNRTKLWNWLRYGGNKVADPAKVPWCGSFMAAVFAHSLPEEPIPNNPAGSIHWLKFGIPCTPQVGSALVFWRGNPNSWKGHIGFYIGETKTHFLVLGGNQSNSVSETLVAKNRLRNGGARWPSTALAPTGLREAVQGSGYIITTNEV